MTGAAKRYVMVVVAVGIGLLWEALAGMTDLTGGDWFHLLLFAALILLIERVPVPMAGGHEVILSTPFIAALAFVHGWGSAAVTIFVAAGASALIRRWITGRGRPWPSIQGMYNAAQDSVCALCGAWAFHLFDRWVGSRSAASTTSLGIGLVAFDLAGLLMMSGLFAALQRRPPWIIAIHAAKEGYQSTLVNLLLGMTGVGMYQVFGYPGLGFQLVLVWAIAKVLRDLSHLRNKYSSTLKSLLALSAQQAGGGYAHAEHVAQLAKAVGERMGLSAPQLEAVYHAGLLHDLGWVKINTAADGLPELNGVDREAAIQHVLIGEQLVKELDPTSPVATFVRYHHERYDGTGYPEGLKGKAIPVEVRILAAADFVDTLRLRAPNSNEEAVLRAIQFAVGWELDPDVATVMATLLRERPELLTERSDSDRIDDRVQTILDTLQETVQKSQLIDSLSLRPLGRMENGQLTLTTQIPAAELERTTIDSLCRQAAQRGETVRERLFSGNGRVIEVYAIPSGRGKVSIFGLDISHLVKHEEEQQKRELAIYRDVIYAVTQGKLDLVTRRDLLALMEDGVELTRMSVATPRDIGRLRTTLKDELAASVTDEARRRRYLVAASEAVTNALRHAGGGEVQIRSTPKGLRVVVWDSGPGIDFHELPKSTLLKGYSTRQSLGQGFTLMLEYADCVILHTSSKGTTLMLEFYSPKEEETPCSLTTPSATINSLSSA